MSTIILIVCAIALFCPLIIKGIVMILVLICGLVGTVLTWGLFILSRVLGLGWSLLRIGYNFCFEKRKFSKIRIRYLIENYYSGLNFYFFRSEFLKNTECTLKYIREAIKASKENLKTKEESKIEQ